MNKQHWKYKKLGEITTLKSGYTPSSSDLLESGAIPYFKVGDMNKEGNEKYLIYTSSFVDSSFKSYPKGSIVFPKNGAAIATNKKRILSRSSVVDLNTAALIPSNTVKIDFLYYWISKVDFRIITRRGAVPTLDTKVLMQLEIPVPPLVEQERIVAELDLLSGIIEKKKEQLKAYDQLAQSIFYTMFGDPIDNPKGWEVKKLKEVTTKIGSGATPKGGNQSYKSDGISLIRSLNVHNGTFKYEDLAHIDEQQAHQLNNVIVEENDVLFNITGASVARCCIVPSDVLPARVNQHVSILRPKKEIVNYKYLCYYLISPNSQNELLSMSKSNAATREAIPKSMMEKYLIPLPPLSLQQEFAEKIEAIERQKGLVQQSIEETQTMFDYTMDKYFG